MINILLIAVIIVIFSSIIKYGFSRNALTIIFSRVWWLRGFFFLIMYIYTCISMMNRALDNSGYWLIPFLVCGIAAMLSMYSKTRKYGLYLFIITLCFGLFVIFPLIGILSSYNSGNATNVDMIGAIIFIGFGICVGISAIITIKKNNK